ncbi:hypothetical protein LCGC14_2359660 [marine sediment metagenome]|uniref:Uncharacterized protein n=1 Tax=marine sediment metagenome TaxID=412755 RepID=A0A0F9EJG2_9ZZZZ
MVKENRFDSVTDKVASRVGRAKAKAHSYFKGTNPYRQKPLSAKEQMMLFAQTDPRVIQAWQNAEDPEARLQANNYIEEMNKLQRSK